MDLEEELGAVVDALHAAGVEYALCGGLALAVHGAPRATIDIDLLVGTGDVARVREIAEGLGFRFPAMPMNFSNIRIDRITKIDAVGDTLMLDLLVTTPELEHVWRGRQHLPWKGRQISVVSREGLVTLKMLRASKQDLADIERLRDLE
ncbi:MAG TPA: hypothetical protein VGF28_13635 [Thermoanaerobaculia bacterium]|jgi:hypothetical protein